MLYLFKIRQKDHQFSLLLIAKARKLGNPMLSVVSPRNNSLELGSRRPDRRFELLDSDVKLFGILNRGGAYGLETRIRRVGAMHAVDSCDICLA